MSKEEDLKVDDPSGKPNQASGDDKDKVSYESYKKLLEEKKSLQEKFSSLSTRLDEVENEKLKAKEDQSEYIKKLEENLKSEREKIKNEKQKRTLSKLNSEFTKIAKAEGCLDPQDLSILLGSKLKDVKVNAETEEIDVDQLKQIVSDAKTLKPLYFSEAAPTVDDIQQKNESKNFNINDDASVDEMKELIRNSIQAGNS